MQLILTQKSCSHTFRQALDLYFSAITKEGYVSLHKPFEKTAPIGLKTISVRIRKDQDDQLRKVSEMTNRGLSELGRDAITQYLAR